MLPSVQKLNVRIFFNNEIFTRVSYTIWGVYEIKTVRNNNVRNIFNAKYNQITVTHLTHTVTSLQHNGNLHVCTHYAFSCNCTLEAMTTQYTREIDCDVTMIDE